MMNINTNNFKANKNQALAFIATALRVNQSYEDGQYYFHVTDDGSIITAYNDYREAESTVTARFSIDDYIIDVMADREGWNFTEEYFTDETQYSDEYYKYYYTDNGICMINYLFWDEHDFGTVISNFENDEAYSSKFAEIVNEIYDAVIEEID